MRIAVTYDNGNVFQHFGQTQQFKLYKVEDGKVYDTLMIDNDGQGHGALAGLLARNGVDVLICGGIGGGAQQALANEGIELCAGAQGDTDAAVEAYLKGELTNAGATCDHHEHEEGHACGEDGCGSGSCGSHGPAIQPLGKNAGKNMSVHYRGTLDDGTQFDSSYDRGQPLEFICGAGQMIAGFDKAVADMEIGQTVNVHLEPAEAYGEVSSENIFTFDKSMMPGSENLTPGQRVHLMTPAGQPIPVTVVACDEKSITFDANHELAGKALNFEITVVDIR